LLAAGQISCTVANATTLQVPQCLWILQSVYDSILPQQPPA
jgi:hypothetical protein